MIVSIIARGVYGLVGALFLAGGATVLLMGSGLIPLSLSDLVMKTAQSDMNTLHVIQELGSLLVFAGLITFWFIRNYDRSKMFHWSMTAFWGLIALVHFVDVRGETHSRRGPLINAIPFAVFLIIGLLRMFADQESRLSPRSAG